MRALDDILIGFFIFFAIDRAIRLFSNAVVEPWALHKTGGNQKASDNYKLGVEFFLLATCIGMVIIFRKELASINRS